MASVPPVVGIDLGTTTSEIALLYNGKVRSIPVKGGEPIIKSEVFYTDDGSLGVGDDAVISGQVKITNSKRFIGRRLYDSDVSKISSLQLEFPVVTDDVGNVRLRHKFQSEEKARQGLYRDLTPQQVSADVLKALKSAFFAYARKEKIKAAQELSAVITVPANFLEPQRKATEEAAQLAGIKVLRLVAEPTAAAVQYLHEKKEDGLFLVFDFGGGTHDVSLVEVKGTGFTVKATAGDTLLGGRDVDQLIFNHLEKELDKQDKPIVISAIMDTEKIEATLRARRELKSAAEQMKINLSNQESVENLVQFDGVGETKIFLNRKTLKSLMQQADLFHRLLQPVKDALGSIPKSDVKAVLLAGGSSRIPAVKEALREFFPSSVEIRDHENLDLVVSRGAAILGESLRRNQEVNERIADEIKAKGEEARTKDADSEFSQLLGQQEGSKDFLSLVDCIPASLGIELHGGGFSVLLEKNAPLPAGKKRIYSNAVDNQTSAWICIYQGENKVAKKNVIVDDTMIVGPIPPLPKGQAKIEVQFGLDHSGVLRVFVKDLTPGGEGVESKREVKITSKVRDQDVSRLSYPKDISDAMTALTRRVYAFEYKRSQSTNFMVRKAFHSTGQDGIGAILTFIHNFHGPKLQLSEIERKSEELKAIEQKFEVANQERRGSLLFSPVSPASPSSPVSPVTPRMGARVADVVRRLSLTKGSPFPFPSPGASPS